MFSLPRVVPCYPFLGLTPSGLIMGLSSTLIYTSEVILCSTIDLSETQLSIREIISKRCIYKEALNHGSEFKISSSAADKLNFSPIISQQFAFLFFL